MAAGGRVSNPWRLGFVLDLFWAIINGIGMFFMTIFDVRARKSKHSLS